MPRISQFYGITIRLNPREHLPPHFHAEYSGQMAAVEIASGEIMAGELPQKAWRMVNEWLEIHRAEVLENWNLVQAGQPAFQVAPLA